MKIIIAAVVAAFVLGLTLRLVPQKQDTEYVSTYWINGQLTVLAYGDNEKKCKEHVKFVERLNQKNLELYGADSSSMEARDPKCFKRKKV